MEGDPAVCPSNDADVINNKIEQEAFDRFPKYYVPQNMLFMTDNYFWVSFKMKALPCSIFFLLTQCRLHVSNTDELGEAAAFFSGDIEVAATHPEFKWLEGPLWSESGKYLLFSDVKWEDDRGVSCGMIWKYSDGYGVEKFLKFPAWSDLETSLTTLTSTSKLDLTVSCGVGTAREIF